MYRTIKVFFTFIVLSITGLTYSQKQPVELDIKGRKINYFINIEKQANSTLYDSNTQHLSLQDVSQPVIFLRKEKKLPDLLIYYTCFKKDSVISSILYEWDVHNFETKDNNKKPLDFEKNLIHKYNEIVDFISKKYGKSKTEGSLDDLSSIDTQKGLKRSDKWNPDSDLMITMYVDISNFYLNDGMVTVNPTHRIRVYVTNVRDEKPEELTKEKLAVLDKNFEKFLALLSKDNFDGIKPLLSEKIKAQATNEVFLQIKEGLQLNRKLELYMNGLQQMQDGNSYPMLQYKYSDDTNTPPVEYITVLFDDDNTLLGLTPFKRKQ